MTRKKFSAADFLDAYVKRVVLKSLSAPRIALLRRGWKVCFLGAGTKICQTGRVKSCLASATENIKIRGCPHVGSVVPIAITTTRKNTQYMF